MPRVTTADVERDVTTTWDHGRKSSIGTSAVQMTTADVPATKGVLVKASAANTGTVYVGDSSGVTADAADGTDGFPLAPGESLLIPIDNANKVYLIATAASHKVWWSVA
jgi:hypothetical protein